MEKRSKKYMYIGMLLIILVCICIQLYKKVYVRDKIIEIPKKEIYSQNMEGNIFMEAIISTEEEYRKYVEIYNFDFEIEKIDFSENSLVVTSRHEVKSFSYNEKNRRRSGNNILDIIFYKKETNKFYFYEIPINMNTWEATGAMKEDVFEE